MNKTILITGASSGIGEGCARKFASQGARLILNARSTDKLTALALELKEKYNADCYVMPFDVRNRESAAEALNALPEEWKSIDVLINNAGLAIGVDKEHEGNPDEWDTVIDTNIKPGLVETNFSVVRFRGIRPLNGNDIAEVAYFAASAPEHMQVAEILVMPTYQATGTIVSKNN